MPISEIADRYSICLLKQERTNEDLSEEIILYRKELESYDNLELNMFVDQLLKINGLIWDQEAEIRKGGESILGLEQVGKRAIEIRNLNKERVSIKNLMVERFGEGFKDIKVNHQSE